MLRCRLGSSQVEIVAVLNLYLGSLSNWLASVVCISGDLIPLSHFEKQIWLPGVACVALNCPRYPDIGNSNVNRFRQAPSKREIKNTKEDSSASHGVVLFIIWNLCWNILLQLNSYHNYYLTWSEHLGNHFGCQESQENKTFALHMFSNSHSQSALCCTLGTVRTHTG